ncbi:MAG: hypothetical protein WBC93_20910, partial [Sulfitobacter sp.]
MRLLLFRFHGDEAHGRAQRRLDNSFSVHCIIFVPIQVIDFLHLALRSQMSPRDMNITPQPSAPVPDSPLASLSA